MNRTTLIAVACAALIAATGFAAAAPGNAPVDAGADSTAEQHANDHAADEQHRNGSERGAAADERNGQGPNVDLPEQVPDHVSQIHERISSFLSDDLAGSLGDAISEVTPGDDEGDAADGDTDTGDDETGGDESQASGDAQPDGEHTESADSDE